jgi:hypothetical protein
MNKFKFQTIFICCIGIVLCDLNYLNLPAEFDIDKSSKDLDLSVDEVDLIIII